ncbi:MAG TPA: hypothetical protein VF475_14700 [Sphingobium sp.]
MADQKPDEYMGYLPSAEFFAIVSRGAMGFRFEPYTADEAGEIMKQATD